MFVTLNGVRRFLFLGVSVFLVFVLSTGPAFAATCYWVGSAGAFWSSATQWASSSGGTPRTCNGTTTPGSADTAVFDSNGNTQAVLDVTSPLTLGALTISSGYTASVSVDATASLTFSSAYNQADGEFYADDNVITFNSTFDLTGGRFDAETALIRTIATNLGSDAWEINGGNLYMNSATGFHLRAWNSTGNRVAYFNTGSFTAPATGFTYFSDGFTISSTFDFDANGGHIRVYGTTGSGLANRSSNPLYDFTVFGTGYTLVGNFEVENDFTVGSGGSFNNGTGFVLTVGGDFINSGTYTASSGTVTLNGTDQTIGGSSTFYKLQKQTPGTLYFQSGTTQTITGGAGANFTAEGTGPLTGTLFLRSTQDGSQWNISVPSSYAFDYVDIQDSNNIGTEVILSGQFANDSGNNAGYSFSGASSFATTAPIPEFSLYLMLITVLVGVGYMLKMNKKLL